MKSALVLARFTAVAALLVAPFAASADTPGPTVSVPGLFSYQTPPGWTVQKVASATYPAAQEIKNGAVAAMITVEIDHTPGPLDQWLKKSLAKNKVQFASYDFIASAPVPCVTASGVQGFRVITHLTANSRSLYFVAYNFTGSADAKIVVTCNCPAADADHYTPIFDAAMKTFVPQ